MENGRENHIEAVENSQEKPASKKQASIKVNYIYSLLNKLVAVIIPIAITPYLARILEPDGNGIISYVMSISSYFILFANLGIETYGQRLIAIERDDKAYVKQIFWEIFVLRFILTAASLVVYYFCFVSSLNTENNVLYAIFSLSIIAVVFDFTWFYQGVENFAILAAVNIFTRAIYVTLIFVLVKTKSDLNTAALLSAGNTVLPFVLSAPFVAKYMRGKFVRKFNPFVHLKKCMVYFIPTVAVQIYTVLDKTMIGLITKSDFENGYYEQADKLIKLPLTLITTLFVIMRSRISYYYARGEFDKIDALTDKSSNLAFLLAFPIMFGMVAVAPTLVPVYLGDGYEKCVTLIYILSPLIIVIAISNLLGTHYYTPFDKQKISNIFLIIGAVVNLLLNLPLIYFWKSYGAAIASVCAELFITVLYVIFARKFFSPKRFVKNGYKYFAASAIMFAVVFVMQRYLPSNIWYLLAEVFTGMALYAILLIVFKDRFVLNFIKRAFDKMFKKTNGGHAENRVSADDFIVSDKRRAVWKTEVEMVKLFVELCEKHGLKYVAAGGTLIGAVRHGGFIPWDDDIDLMMPRADYEKFLSVAQSELPPDYFLQCNKTEKRYPCGHAQIRNNNTACIRSGEFQEILKGRNAGIFIDIFPYDHVPDDRRKRDKIARKIARMQKFCSMKIYSGSRSIVKYAIKKIVSGLYFMFRSVEKTIEKINELSAGATGGKATDTVALISAAPGYEKEVWRSEWFDDVEHMDFMDMKIAVPSHWDDVLRHEFGDYMKLPDDVSSGSMHGKCLFDTDRSYTAYLEYDQAQIDEMCGSAVL